MPGAARVNDIWSGICCCHPPIPCVGMAGPIITFSNDVTVNGRGMARLGDSAIGFCGHGGVIVSSSSGSNCNGRGMARLGDAVVGCIIGTIVTCSPDVNTT